jgi:hypothetical protein
MEDAAEAIASSYVEVAEPFRFGYRFGERAQWRRSVEHAVRSVFVVEGFVLVECVPEVGFVHDQGAVEEFDPT